MSAKRRILLQLDTDPRPSAFDAIVAADAGAELVFPYGGVTPENVRDLVYGAIFTRGPKDLHHTAISIGGSDVGLGEQVLDAVRGLFLGPLRVSVLLDCGGANTTAAAAVLAAARHFDPDDASLAGRTAVVLGSTGPVGRRVVRLLARRGARVRAASRSAERARRVAEEVGRAAGFEHAIEGVAAGSARELDAALEGAEVAVAAGGPGALLLPREARVRRRELRVVVDLNAVPPAGVEGVEPQDAGVERDGCVAYGALGVGGIKMRIHKAAIAEVFVARDRVLDAEEVLEIGRGIFR